MKVQPIEVHGCAMKCEQSAFTASFGKPPARLGHRSRLSLLLWLMLAAVLVVACTGDGADAVVRSTVVDALAAGDDLAFARPSQPIDFEFPKDHGPHPEYRTEWWYYTGNLSDADEKEFGYQLTFFRNALSPEAEARDSALAANQIYLGHFAVTDGAGQQHYSFDRYSRGAAGLAGATGEGGYSVWIEDWSVVEVAPGVTRVQAAVDLPGEDSALGQIAIDLTLRETQPPVLHGDRGLSQKGPESGNANYYYSLVRLATEGTVTVGDQTSDVTGLSWMDHEFGTSALSGDAKGWDWFSVQLDNGANFMFGEFHNGAGGDRFVYEGSLVLPDGQKLSLADGDFELTALDQWRSPNSGLVYPFGWRVLFPKLDIELQIEPIVEDQEMDVGFVYYEGATRITGEWAGETVSGRGFVELTGYGDQLDGIQR